jgi:hypothetical protein
LPLALREQLYTHYLAEAQRFAELLKIEPESGQRTLEGALAELQFFTLPVGDRRH